MSILRALKRGRVHIKTIVSVVLILFAVNISSCGTKSAKSSSLTGGNIKITQMKYDSFSDKSKLIIRASTPLKYTIYKLTNPDKLNIELYGADYDKKVLDSIASMKDGAISGIEVSRDEKGHKSNIKVTLNKGVEYNVLPNGSELSVEFMHSIDNMLKLKKDDVLTDNTKQNDKGFDIVTADSRLSDENRIKTVASVDENTIKTAMVMPDDIDLSAAKTSSIDSINIDDSKGNLSVEISGKGNLDDYATIELSDPTRLILDVWDVKKGTSQDNIVVASNSIDTIDVFEQKNKVRLVFNSKDDELPVYDLNADSSNIVVAFKNVSNVAAVETPVETAAATTAPKEIPAPAASAPAKKGKKLVVTGLDFDYKEKSSKVIVTTNDEASYEVKDGDENKIVLDFENTRIPKKLSRFMDTSQFSSNITYIEPKKTDGGISLIITLKEDVPYNIIQDENKVYVEVENPYDVVEKIEQKIVTKEVVVKKKKKDPKKVSINPAEIKGGKISAREQQRLILDEIKQAYRDIDNIGEEPETETKTYTGQRMSIDFKGADIHNVLRLIAEVSGFNVVTSDEVKGKVSIHLNNVPWDQALDVILNVKDLGLIKRDNIILILPLAKIHAADERKKQKIKSLKEEKLEEIKRKQKDLEELKPVELKVIPINYANVEDLSAQIAPILTERGSISVDTRTNVVIIKDIAENIEEAEEMIARLDTVTPQVLIEARIVEANTNFSRQFGIQWGTRYSAGPQYGNALPYDFPNSFSVGGGAGGGNSNYFVDLPAAIGPQGGGAVDFTFGHIANTLTLDMRLSAMEASGEGRIVSSPRVVTLDNTQATIEQGTSIPYETTSDSGTETEFVDANLSLTVTPHITADGSVKLLIKASKNSPNLSIVSNGQPAIDKKEANTEILVKDGETTVIGGIFVISESEAEGGVPVLKDIPLIGWMFKTKLKTKTRSELLIFITPRIIKVENKVNKVSL